MKAIIGSDHAGISGRKEAVRVFLERGWEVHEKGPEGDSEKADYPDIAHLIAQSVTSGESRFGVLVCGTGQGMAMTANRGAARKMTAVATPKQRRILRRGGPPSVGCSASIRCSYC